MAVELKGEKAINRIVSHLDGVHGAVGKEAAKIKGKAERRLASHRQTGAASVTQTQGDVDWFVNLEDPAAMSIEFGHWVEGKYKDREHPQYVPGLYILSGAAGLTTSAKSGPRRGRK